MLPQFRKSSEPVFHKFVCFSVIDEDDDLVQKFCECNNCGVVYNSEENISIMSIDDI